MKNDIIIFYDKKFITKFEELKIVLETDNRPKIYQFLLKEFQFVFKINQYYWIQIAEHNARDFLEEEEEIKQELMRPLSHRQYRMIERSFSHWLEEEDHVIWSIWDFLHDNGRIYQKKVMSSAEVAGCSMILENVYCRLAKSKGSTD